MVPGPWAQHPPPLPEAPAVLRGERSWGQIRLEVDMDVHHDTAQGRCPPASRPGEEFTMVPGCVRRPDDGVTRTFYLRLSGQYSQRHLLVIPRDTGGTLMAT